jgi:predicted SAM-dependent methyltransferase
MIKKIIFLLINLHRIPKFTYQFLIFRKKNEYFKLRFIDLLPILDETNKTMSYDAHYVYHTAWAARILNKTRPKIHYDISSSLMFCAIASSHTKIYHYDFRKPDIKLSNLDCFKADLNNLPFENESLESLSCMHVIEHVGLGRYGDKIDVSGDSRSAKELIRVLSKNGKLLIVVPLAEIATIRFNAHRIYDKNYILNMFKPLKLIEFSFLNDKPKNQFIQNAKDADLIGQKYGCGCFLFEKK